MPGLGVGQVEAGAPALLVNSRLEAQGMKKSQENADS